MTFATDSPSAWKRPRAVLTLFGLAGSLGLVLALFVPLQSVSEPGSRIFLQLSFSRLALLTVGLLVAAALGRISFKAWKEPAWADATWSTFVTSAHLGPWVRWVSLFVFCLGWIALFTPSQRFSALQAIHLRLIPLLTWLAFFGAGALAISLLGIYEIRGGYVRESLRARKAAWWLSAGVLGTSLAVLALSRWFDLFPREDYSYGAGVPVLSIQIWIALAAALLFQYSGLAGRLARVKRLDLAICLGLWALTALLWAREPIPASYFNPGPYLPNNEYYPFSDAALFDLGGQYEFIGQGLNAGVPFDRPVYMQWLFFLRAAGGQEYAAAVNLQAVLLAFLPALLYLIGTEIAGRPFGLGLGLAGALRGLNSIAGASLIDLGSPKHMLTDFPTALGAAALVYLLVRWLKRPAESRLFALWAGGILGLLSLVRTTAVLLLLPVTILLVVVHRRNWTAAVTQPAIFLTMAVLAVLPWGIPSHTSMLEIYLQKFRDVIQQRYSAPASLLIPRETRFRSGSPAPMSRSLDLPPEIAKAAAFPQADSPADLGFIPRHFFHNLLTSFLILPASPGFLDLRSTVRGDYPYWQSTWDGAFAPPAALFLAGQFILLCFGVGMAWRRTGFAGLAPLVFFLTYQLANALGRTSGGRFIVPVDWIVLLYYLLGFAELCFLLFELAGRREMVPGPIPTLPVDRLHWSKALVSRGVGLAALFVVVGLSPTITGSLFPVRYTEEQAAAVLGRLSDAGQLESLNGRSSVDGFLDKPGAVMIQGRALYPRFYRAGRGELDSGYPYLTLPYPRLAFTTIGPRTADAVLLPLERSPEFRNASDVLILGCQVELLRHVEALAVFVLNEDGTAAVYLRQPAAPLQCPVPAIECNENRECRSAP